MTAAQAEPYSQREIGIAGWWLEIVAASCRAPVIQWRRRVCGNSVDGWDLLWVAVFLTRRHGEDSTTAESVAHVSVGRPLPIEQLWLLAVARDVAYALDEGHALTLDEVAEMTRNHAPPAAFIAAGQALPVSHQADITPTPAPAVDAA